MSRTFAVGTPDGFHSIQTLKQDLYFSPFISRKNWSNTINLLGYKKSKVKKYPLNVHLNRPPLGTQQLANVNSTERRYTPRTIVQRLAGIIWIINPRHDFITCSFSNLCYRILKSVMFLEKWKKLMRGTIDRNLRRLKIVDLQNGRQQFRFNHGTSWKLQHVVF